MSRVKLISWSGGDIDDPRRLILIAVKTSAGKVGIKGLDHYLKDYPKERLSEWVKASVAFPSVLEHVWFTFIIENVSRVMSHQLVRHRLASYTQESQRYSATIADYVIPRTIKENGFEKKFSMFAEEAKKLYNEMVEAGIPYEDARFILPQAVKTRLIMTVNLRELIHITCLRGSTAAQWEIREVVKEMINEASKVIPELPYLVKEGCSRGL